MERTGTTSKINNTERYSNHRTGNIKITILIDNVPDNNKCLHYEHGLSMFIETKDKRFIVDTGLTGLFAENAKTLGIDLSTLDFCILSHGHIDHTGGLNALYESNKNIKTYLSERIFNEQYFSSRHVEKKNLSTDYNTLEVHKDIISPLEKSTWITSGIAAVFCSNRDFPLPKGNTFLTKKAGEDEVPDDFKHEISLAIHTDEGLVICSSCSHNGVMNILKSCIDFTQENRVKAFVGGLHFVDCNQTEKEVTDFCKDISRHYPDIQIFTGHCTCDKAKSFLQKSSVNIKFFHTGSSLII